MSIDEKLALPIFDDLKVIERLFVLLTFCITESYTTIKIQVAIGYRIEAQIGSYIGETEMTPVDVLRRQIPFRLRGFLGNFT